MNEYIKTIKRKSKRALAAWNYDINSICDADPKTTTRDRVVCDQNGLRGRRFVYGDYPARHNACEVIAVHNARVILGFHSALSETVTLFHGLRAMIFHGFFGSNVYKTGKVLTALGIPYEKIRLKKMTRRGLYIISYWNEKPLKNGIHTVTVLFDGNRYTTYNLHGNGIVSREDPRQYAKRFIVGYYLGDKAAGPYRTDFSSPKPKDETVI